MPKVQSTLELVAQALKEEKPTSLALIAEKIKARYPLGGLPSPAPEPSPPPARLHCITHKMGKTTVYLYKALDPIFSPDKEDATLFKNQEIAEAVKKIIPFDKAKVVPYPLET